ncbi:MAG: sodium-dependent transporter [Pseudomonadales bacterium]
MAVASHEQWSSRFGFLMAAIGFAVGLGNIWRFPYITGENGGGAFILVYLFCVFCIGAPILIGEIMIGRRGHMSPVVAMRTVAQAEGRSRAWQWVGAINLFTAFIISVVYIVVIGWVLYYLSVAVTTGFTATDGGMSAARFDGLMANVPGMLLWTAVGLVLTGLIIYSGVQKGIERAVRVLMPTLFTLLVLLAGYNLFAGGFPAAADYLFSADFSKVGPATVLAAVGQAFFSVGVAMAGMMTFGAYLPRDISIPRSVFIIVGADTLVALVAGFVIFPAVFKFGLDPAGGPGLVFQTLPVAFAQMPGGQLVAVLFFVLLAVGGITSMVGLVEPVVSWLEEHRGLARHASTILTMSVVGLLSILSVLSYNVLAGYQIFGRDLNGVLDYVSNQILLPLGGFLIACFVGWFVSRRSSEAELDMANPALFRLWYLSIRYLVPPAVLLILVTGLSW